VTPPAYYYYRRHHQCGIETNSQKNFWAMSTLSS
jgi:hypothetical protein